MKNVLLSLGLFIFVWPTLLLARDRTPDYPLLSVALALVIVALTVGWGRLEHSAEASAPGSRVLRVTFGLIAIAVLAYAAQHWITLVLWNPFRTDMLVVIREGISRFLSGRDPYTTYSTYDAPWVMVLPYGPALWGPFVAPYVAGVDLRVVTLIGALFVPACCGWAASLEAGRGRVLSAASWLLLLIALTASLDLTEFAVMGHTPAYWPLIPIFAVLVAKERWVAAAATLGILLVARSTMVALVPGFLMAVWFRNRAQLWTSVIVYAAVAGALLLPFVIWDPRSIWYNMVASYPKIIKEVVWLGPEHGVTQTFGVTGWLLSNQWGRFVEVSQLVAMAAACACTWWALRRGARPLPWMALGLFVFSATCLWPVYYIYFDVFLLFASAAMADAFGGDRAAGFRSWLITLATLTLVVLLGMRIGTRSFPSIEMSAAESARALLEGFDRNRDDGDKEIAPITAPRAVLALPRASTTPATVVIDARTLDGPPQRVEAILNGKLLGSAESDGQWRALRFPAPASAWWRGFNRLELRFSEAHPTLGVHRIGVEQ